MSYPTPWRVEHGKRNDVTAFSADNSEVIWFDKYETSIYIPLDDLVSRINAGAEAEAWKKEATIVIEKISLHEVGKALNVPLGGCISSAILPGIQELTARAERAEKALEEAYRAGLAAAELSFLTYCTFSDSPMSYAAYLKEKEKK